MKKLNFGLSCLNLLCVVLLMAGVHIFWAPLTFTIIYLFAIGITEQDEPLIFIGSFFNFLGVGGIFGSNPNLILGMSLFGSILLIAGYAMNLREDTDDSES